MSTTVVAKSAQSLLHMSRAELDELYRASPTGPIPIGDTQGTAILFAGTILTRVLARLVKWFFWRGKVFDPLKGELRNKISPFGFLAIRAQVYADSSWMDGRPTIVIDYSKTSFVARMIRDEIRLIGPGMYLGKVWWGKRRIADFALRCSSGAGHQEAVTVLAKLRPGGVEPLRAVLSEMDADVEENALLPFTSLDGVHFARFVILPEARDIHGKAIPPSLVYATNVDAPHQRHLAQLMERGEALDRIFEHCEGYPGLAERTERTRLAFLQDRMIPSQAFYVNTVGRTVRQARDEIRLREAIQAHLDGDAAAKAVRSPAEVRTALQELCQNDPALEWALRPVEPLALGWRLRERLRFYAILAALLILSPVLLPVAALGLLGLRRREIADAREPALHLSEQPRGQLAILEDQVVQNQFSAVGNVKAEWIRAVTLRLLLAGADLASRHHFNKGDLGTVPLLGLHGVNTIHFAQWVVIDEGRRVLFMSNYDGSLSSYMDDFINKVAWGLNAVFSNGQGYPATRWLVKDGANDEQSFKAFLQKHQIPTQVWYTAHKNSTALNLANNARIRAGLSGAGDPDAVERWAQRL